MAKNVIHIATATTGLVDTLYVWIARRSDGGEGIICTDLDDGARGRINTPLMADNRAQAEAARPHAELAQRMAHDAGQEIEIELRAFRRVPE